MGGGGGHKNNSKPMVGMGTDTDRGGAGGAHTGHYIVLLYTIERATLVRTSRFA